MKLLRRIHLLLGCLFAPLLLYYCLSGASQALGLNFQWRDGKNQPTLLSEFSRPHKAMTMPGASGSNQKKSTISNRSESFKYFAVVMAVGISATLILGVVMAYKYFRPRWMVTAILAAGLAVPILMLWSSVKEWRWQAEETEPFVAPNIGPSGVSVPGDPEASRSSPTQGTP